MPTTGLRYSGLGYMSYGTPGITSMPGPASPYQPSNSPSYGAPVTTQFLSGTMPPLTLGYSRAGAGNFGHPTRRVPGTRVPMANSLRSILRGVVGIVRPGVAAQTPQIASIGVGPQGAVRQQYIPYTTPGPNANTPLFGRPGFHYTSAQPAWRTGPAPKLSPGTGSTSSSAIRDNRALGFQPAGYATQQHMPMQQFDYTPATDPTYDVGDTPTKKFKTLPRTIDVGIDGFSIVGTYRAHDFTPADRFFKQGRSASNWQDMSFGPNYRLLLPYQQVARYNLYNSIQMARPLSPNNYFLGYQTQPGIASQLGGALGQGRPLGY